MNKNDIFLKRPASVFGEKWRDGTPLGNGLTGVNLYGGAGAELLPAAKKQARQLTELGFGGLPVCVAKTQYSLSDDPALLGRPSGFRITVREIRPSLGAGFVVAVCGSILTMPGLPKTPAAENIDVRGGEITGLF